MNHITRNTLLSIIVFGILFAVAGSTEVKADNAPLRIDVINADGTITAQYINGQITHSGGNNDVILENTHNNPTVLILDEDLSVVRIRTTSNNTSQVFDPTDLTITGNGTLSLHTSESGASAIEQVKKLTIESGTVRATCTNSGTVAIAVKNGILITGGDITADNNGSTAILTNDGDIEINGGKVTAGVGEIKSLLGSVIVRGGEVNVNSTNYDGIYAGESFEVSGGKVSVNSNLRAINVHQGDTSKIRVLAPVSLIKPSGGGIVAENNYLTYITESDGTTPAKNVVIGTKTPGKKEDDSDHHEDSPAPSNNNKTKVPDGCDELRQSLSNAIAAASASGKPQTVYWSKGTSLPYDVMQTLHDHANITLVFSYTYLGNDFTVTIPGSAVIANPSIPWYGPVYLYALYGGAKAPAFTTMTASTGSYNVKSGDTLSAIARRLKTTVKHLKEVNNIKNVDRIKPGMILKY